MHKISNIKLGSLAGSTQSKDLQVHPLDCKLTQNRE